MNPIHQIYCTHCTYGTSALEQREGELADRVLGYSARASSLERADLRNCYRQFERFLYYYLPSDTPAEEKLRLDASTAPRRLFYSPALGEFQVLGQISYRQQDTAGRPGSYFAHVLVGSRENHWSPLDCLQLWGAHWADEDSEKLSAKLPELEQLDALLDGSPPAIDDRLLLNFLKSPVGEPFDDPRKVIPERWRYVAPADRAELLAETLQGFLNLGSQRRENLLLVIEPSVAALLFYGVARLLPPGPVRDGLSFSTFEPNADRLPVSLAATTFHSPETTDLRPDAYRRRGYVRNTFVNRYSEHGLPEGNYGRLLVDMLLAAGSDGVDQLLGGFHSSGAKTPEDLELLADVHPLVERVLDPAATLNETLWRQSDVATRYLSQAVHRQLANDAAGWPQLRALIGSPNQLLVMELIASAPGAAEIHGPLQYLLRKLPADRFGELLASMRLPRSAKVEALAYYLSTAGRFPEHCESLWNEGSRLSSILAGRAEPLLPAVLSRLPAQVIAPLYRTLPPEQAELFLLAVVRGGRPEPELQAALRAVVGDILKEWDDARVVAWLADHRDELRSFFALPDNTLRPRLARLLFEIPDHPQQLEARLAALEGWIDYFSDPALAERRLVQWQKIRATLSTICEAMSHKPANRFEAVFRKPKPPDYRSLAEALQTAMPMNVYPDDLQGTRKLAALDGLGRALLGKDDFLPPVVRSRMVRFFEYGDWSEYTKPRSHAKNSSKKRGKKQAGSRHKSAGRRQRAVPAKLLVGAVAAAIVIVAGGVYVWQKSGARALQPSKPPRDAIAKTNVASKTSSAGDSKNSPKSKTDAAFLNKSTKPGKASSADSPNALVTPLPDKPQPDQTSPDKPQPDKPPPPTDPASAKPKPAPENAPPASSLAEPAAKQEAPASAGPRLAAKGVDLPRINRQQPAPSKPLEVFQWSEAPKQLELTLHGLQSANERLKQGSPNQRVHPRLTLAAHAAGHWLVAVETGADEQVGPGKDLATFTATQSALEFRWSDADLSPETTAARACLRTCVLELNRDGVQDFRLLSAPAKLPGPHFINGEASFTPQQPDGLPPGLWDGIELKLASCSLDFSGDRLTLIAGNRPADPFFGAGFASAARIGGVRVALHRDEKKRESWRLSLAIDPPADLLEQQQDRAEQQSEYDSINAELAAWSKPEATPERKLEAIRTLASLLDLEPPKPTPGKKSNGAQAPLSREFSQAAETQIMKPARDRRTKLQAQLRQQRQALNTAEAEFNRRTGDMRSRVESVSAILTRSIDERLDAVCIMLGDPEPIAEPAAEKPSEKPPADQPPAEKPPAEKASPAQPSSVQPPADDKPQ